MHGDQQGTHCEPQVGQLEGERVIVAAKSQMMDVCADDILLE